MLSILVVSYEVSEDNEVRKDCDFGILSPMFSLVIETNLQKAGGLTDEAYQTFLKRSIEVTHPLAASLGRVGQPEEVGELIAFLVSGNARFITGECIAIDGGRQNLGAR